MARVQTLVLFLGLLLGGFVQAQDELPAPLPVQEEKLGFDKWAAEATVAGFLGDYALGVMREWNETHAVHLSLGVYKIYDIDYTQFNLGYTYRADWNYRFQSADDINWHFLTSGIYILRSLDNTHYFRTSPSKYPSAGYYDPTAWRIGVSFGTSITFFSDTTELRYFFMILDNGIVSWFNNQRERDLISYYISHGLALSYRF